MSGNDRTEDDGSSRNPNCTCEQSDDRQCHSCQLRQNVKASTGRDPDEPSDPCHSS